MSTLTARETLEASRLFVAQADAAGTDISIFRYNLEAAIVFARSVTFHVQKELSHHSTFDSWYDTWRRRLGADPRCRYFLEKRNFVLKEGRLGLRQDVTVFVNAGLEMKVELGVTVVRGQPW